jgi:hypothetical protein
LLSKGAAFQDAAFQGRNVSKTQRFKTPAFQGLQRFQGAAFQGRGVFRARFRARRFQGDVSGPAFQTAFSGRRFRARRFPGRSVSGRGVSGRGFQGAAFSGPRRFQRHDVSGPWRFKETQRFQVADVSGPRRFRDAAFPRREAFSRTRFQGLPGVSRGATFRTPGDFRTRLSGPLTFQGRGVSGRGVFRAT